MGFDRRYCVNIGHELACGSQTRKIAPSDHGKFRIDGICALRLSPSGFVKIESEWQSFYRNPERTSMSADANSTGTGSK